MTTVNKRCQTCGAELPEAAPGNRCRKCLLELGLLDAGGAWLPASAAASWHLTALAERGLNRASESVAAIEKAIELTRKAEQKDLRLANWRKQLEQLGR